MLKTLGVSARDAQVILGHAHVAVTLGIYSEVFDDESMSAISLVETALGGSVRPAPTDVGGG
jgi:hypothetical protein